MNTRSHSSNPIEERIKYHMACLEARKHGAQEPEAPWLKQPEGARELNTAGSETALDDLTMPSRPRARSVTKSSPTRTKVRKEEPKSSKNQSTAPAAVVMAPREEVSPLPSQSIRALLSFPPFKEPKPIPLLEEKIALIESLLLRAGVPSQTVKGENLSRRVLEAYQDFERLGGEESKTAIVQRYEIGRHFCQAGMSHFAAFADVIIPLLQASEVKDFTNKRFIAEETAERLCSKK